jgi:ribonucleotide reductase alpha subunit
MYVRRVRAGEFIVVNPHLLADLVDKGLWTKEVLRKRRAVLYQYTRMMHFTRIIGSTASYSFLRFPTSPSPVLTPLLCPILPSLPQSCPALTPLHFLHVTQVRNHIIANGGSIADIPDISAEMKEIYRTVWEIRQRSLIDMAADRGNTTLIG